MISRKFVPGNSGLNRFPDLDSEIKFAGKNSGLNRLPKLDPKICPDCLERNVVAQYGGPTCPHGQAKGGFWPTEWQAMPEPDRLAWLRAAALAQPARSAGSGAKG